MLIRFGVLALCLAAGARAQIFSGSPEAQKSFQQGLADLYAFDFQAAVNSFHRASELAPKSPMPYWGMAMANGPNYNAWTPTSARKAAAARMIAVARQLAPGAPPVEQAYVRTLPACFPNAPSRCADAMRELHRAYPDDPDAAVLFAASLMNIHPWHLWTVDGKPGPETPEIVAVLEEVLRRWPDHLGANHYYIHAMEASPHPERALPSAHRLETLAPTEAHLVHMPAHIYLHTGDYAAAVQCNLRAVAVDEAHDAAMGYAQHNLHFLAVAAGMDGEYQVAVDAASKLQTHAHSGAFVVMPMVVRLRFARWDDLLALPPANGEIEGVSWFRHFARGFAFATKGDAEQALEERKLMDQEYAKLKPGRAFGMYFNDWSAIQELAGTVLDARIAAARGDLAGAVQRWQSAATLEDHLNFDDVPDWYYPVRESWGTTLLRAGKPAEAEAVFREDLRRNPRNPRSLLGLSQSLEAQKKSADADAARREFQAAWKGSVPPRWEDY